MKKHNFRAIYIDGRPPTPTALLLGTAPQVSLEHSSRLQPCVTLLWLQSWVLSRPLGTGLRSIRLSARIPAGLPGKVLLSSSGWGSLVSKLRMCSTATATTKPEPGGAGREVLIPTERARKQRFWWHCFVPGAQPRWRLSRITRLFSDISQ